MRRIVLAIALIATVFVGCKDKKEEITHNLYDYKDYISSHTYGIISKNSSIKMWLNTSIESKELTDDIVEISPNVKGTLSIENGHMLVFKPDEFLSSEQNIR